MQPTIDSKELETIATLAERVLPLASIQLTDDYYYASLPLCVIDAVYSIGVRYEGVRRVVNRYCIRTDQPKVRANRVDFPDESQQESVSIFCQRFEQVGLEGMTSEYFGNRQRTSARSGILKAEAVYRFAMVLRQFDVECLQHIAQISTNANFEHAIHLIPGQRSGICLQYFWMLAGSDDLVKADRMIIRFLETALDRKVKVQEALLILRAVTTVLLEKHPQLTPRLLDYAIWQYQRQTGSNVIDCGGRSVSK